MRRLYKLFLCYAVVVLMVGCGSKGTSAGGSLQSHSEEDREAKTMLQGVWQDEESEEISFWVKGDTIYYPDSVSQPTAFAIFGDQLVLYSTDSYYHIEKQTEHVFWFKNQGGDIVKLVKSEDDVAEELEKGVHQMILTYNEVVKVDSVITFGGERYHWYIAINPTKYKVHTMAYNDDGVEVDNIYYDNIMHVSVFKGAVRIFSQDFKKNLYESMVPKKFLSQSVLSNMEFARVDNRGFHFVATICIPDGATCYKAENIVSFNGHLST